LYAGRAAWLRRSVACAGVSGWSGGGAGGTAAQPAQASTRAGISRFIVSCANIAALDSPKAISFLLAAALVSSVAARADVSFRTGQVQVAGHALKVEIADHEPQRMQGLMFRKKLGANDGMVFLFEEPGYHSMWMKNTLIPLSVAFIDGEGRILNILDMEPETLDAHTAAGPAVFALETNKGWFAAKKVKPGDKVTGLPKP
jgi:uncharacterized membrane protein (UPF0127 family)